MMKRIQFAILLLLCILFGLISESIVSRVDYPNSDFFSFWLAGRMVLTHQNPYIADEWVSGHHLFGAEWISDQTFLYPLPLAFFFLPFGLLNLYQAYVIWVWVSQIMLLVVILLLLTLFKGDRRHYIVPLVSGIILFRPVVSLLLNGQLSAFLLLIFVIAGILWDRERWIWGGTIISLSLLKPNIGIPSLALIGVYLFSRKSYKGFIGMVIASVMMVLIAGLYDPNWLGEYLEVVKSKQVQTFGYSPTIWGVSAFVSKFNLPGTLLVGSLVTFFLLVFYFIMVTRLNEITPLAGVSLSITIALLITPYLWPYDQIMLVLPIVLIMANLKNMHTHYLWSALVFLVIDIVVWVLFWISTRIQIENLNGLLPLLVLGIYSFTLLRHRTISTAQPALAPDAASATLRRRGLR